MIIPQQRDRQTDRQVDERGYHRQRKFSRRRSLLYLFRTFDSQRGRRNKWKLVVGVVVPFCLLRSDHIRQHSLIWGETTTTTATATGVVAVKEMLSGGSNGAVDKITLTRQSFSSLPFPKAAEANFLLHYRYYPMIIHPAVVGMVMLPNLCIGRMKVSGSAVAQTLTANGAPKMMTDRQSPKGCSSIRASISGLGNMHHRHCWVPIPMRGSCAILPSTLQRIQVSPN